MNEFEWICEVWLNLWLSYLRYNFRIFQQLKALIIINVFFFIKKFHKNISEFLLKLYLTIKYIAKEKCY